MYNTCSFGQTLNTRNVFEEECQKVAIIYTCRHCGQHIGRLEEHMIESEQLGFNELTVEEKREMIEYKSNGDLNVYAICDDCTSALAEHPQYHELDYFIH